MSEKDLRPPCKFCSLEKCFLLEADAICTEAGCTEKVMEELKEADLAGMELKITKIKEAAERLQKIYEKYSSDKNCKK